MNRLRVTTRRPKSCLDCSRRRVKCNKEIPCDVCIKRETQDTCRRETVLIRGKVVNDPSEYKQSRNAELEQSVEILQKENDYLRSKLEKYKMAEAGIPSRSIQIEPTKFGLFGKSVSLITRKLDIRDNNVDFNYLEFLELKKFLTYEVSSMLIDFNLERIYFFHCLVLPEIFLREHESFFMNGEHVDENINRTRNEYLWLSIYYALIANSLLILDELLLHELKIQELDAIRLGQISIYASIECLHRSQFLKYPSLKTLQVFGILATSCYVVLGVDFQNSFLGCCINIARILNLHKLTQPNDQLNLLNFELSCRIWWLLVVVDWFEDSSENIRPLINPDEFSTPLPRNISDFNLINSVEKETSLFLPITYNYYMFKLSSIKREFYYNNKITSYDNDIGYLEYAYSQIIKLEKEIDEGYKIDDSNKYFKDILFFKFNHEKLSIKKQVVNLKYSNKLEIRNDVDTCHSLGIELVKLFNGETFPEFYKKYWMISEHSINGAIFVLINMTLNEKSITLDKIKAIEKFVKNLQIFLKSKDNPIAKGIIIIKKLLEIIGNKSDNSLYELELNEVHNILESLNLFQKVYEDELCRVDQSFDDSYWNEFLSWITAETLTS